MTKPRDIRRLLNQLAALGMLIDYNLHQRYGQTVMIRGVGDRPIIVSLAAAKAAAAQAAREAERKEWWE